MAILMVVGFHASIIYPLAASWMHQVAELGNMGVQLFFLISAVTMCHMWEQRRDEASRVCKFYIRRFLRIAPLFWCAIIFYTYLWHLTPDRHALSDITFFDIGLTVLFLHPFAVSAINSVVPGGWSIGIEMGFYGIFPLLARLRGTRLLLSAFAMYLLLGLAGTAFCERFGSGEQYSTYLYYSFLTQLPIFPIGMFVHSLADRDAGIRLPPTLAIVALWLVVAFMGKYAVHLTARPFFWCEVFMLALLLDVSIRWKLQSRFLAFFGRLSYSIYLLHFAVLYFLEKEFGNRWAYWVGLPVALAVTASLAMISSVTAEKWSQDAARTLIGLLRGGRPNKQLSPPQSRSS
jgi:exopolysaccharide production protein ExoZ